jgi:hypothetical protein
MLDESLQLSPRISVAPVLHGSGDFAVEVRRIQLAHKFDCLAVPLPPSFQTSVEQAIDHLPNITAVIQEERPSFSASDWTPESEVNDHVDNDAQRRVSYVPVDPCQPVIAALRVAIQERTPRAFIDLESDHFESHSLVLPDPYALKRVSIERFSAAALLGIPRPPEGLTTDRIRTMAARLKELETRYERILFVCALTDWPWIREAYTQGLTSEEEDAEVEVAQLCSASANSLLFMLGELPFLTGLYEQARAELDSDENLSVDGLKQLLLASRDQYQIEMRSLARRITPKLMSVFLGYVRNLSLIERRMTPDLYTLIIAARQIFGDSFAIELADVSRSYPYISRLNLPEISFGIDIARLPDGGMADVVSRLPGPPVQWRTCELNAKPPRIDQDRWKMRWNPHRQCSWPPEDVAIENFRDHVKDAALSMMGAELAQTEKFSASLKDGLDIRETLRNWHTGDLYVKVFPPKLQGTLDCVLMFFDSPADPRDYPWRITWMAEHNDESTLSLFASDFQDELAGPGIGLAKYGGAMFLFPPREIMDVWHDVRLDFTDTLEERLLAGACMHSRERHIAVLSDLPPGAGWRRLAKQYGKKLVHVPLGRFSQETIQRLRMVHVLNGQEVRSFAAHFIRGS